MQPDPGNGPGSGSLAYRQMTRGAMGAGPSSRGLGGRGSALGCERQGGGPRSRGSCQRYLAQRGRGPGRAPGPTASHLHARVSPRRLQPPLPRALPGRPGPPGREGRPRWPRAAGRVPSGRRAGVPISADHRRPPPTRGRDAVAAAPGAVRNEMPVRPGSRGRARRAQAGRWPAPGRRQPRAQPCRSWKRGRRAGPTPSGAPKSARLPPAAPRLPCGCGPWLLARVWSRGLLLMGS